MIKRFNLKIFAVMIGTAALLSSCGLGKMVKNYPTVQYEVTPEVLEANGGEVEVNVKGSFPEKYFHKKASVTFQPVLEYEGGSARLKPLTLQGEKAEGNGTVINSKTGGTFSYKDVVPFDPAMKAADFKASATASLGKKSEELGTLKLADGVIATSTKFVHDESQLVANKETAKMLGMDLSEYYEKVTLVTKSAGIFFVVNRYNLNLRHELNKTEAAMAGLADLEEFLGREWEIKDIAVNAWASPEGEESLNQGLSEKRSKTAEKWVNDYFNKMLRAKAKALKVRVRTLEKIEPEFKLAAKGEDWQGFLKAMEKSSIQDKNAILNVVKSQKDVTQREQEIRNMSVIYKEIEDQILPPLRRAEMTVTCFEPKKTDEEIAMLSTSKPDSLDNKELVYAASLTDDINTKLNIYESNIKYFPEDWKGYANAGAINLAQGNADEAASLFDKANTLSPNNPIVLNNLGALAAKNGDFAGAKAFYSQAKSKGVDVSYNSGILQINDGDYSGALTSFGNKKCNYNVALAQVLSKDLAPAVENLKCAPQNAEVFYLMAVVGARQNDSGMVYDNLKKAIASDASYKAEAAIDREFLKFFDKDEFMSLVK